MTSDPQGARSFYGELFGWVGAEANPEFGGYFNFSKGEGLVAGCMRNDDANIPDAWSVYLQVENAHATVDKVAVNGGTVIVPPMEVGPLGSMAVMTDAGGAVIGLWQPGTHQGTAVLGEPGTPAWFEVATRDFDKTVAFYKNVFGWDTHPMQGSPLPYTTLGDGPTATAGIMDAATFLPDGVPAHWLIYFEVEDAAATITKAMSMGASVVQPLESTPFGQMAVLTDPTGALFKIKG